MPEELTKAQLARQDEVDNACYAFLLELAKGSDLPWDMEDISEVREAVQTVLVERRHILSEMEFYPFIDLSGDGEVELPDSVSDDGMMGV